LARILVAEDVPEMREALDLVLRQAGHEAVLTADGEAALARLGESAFDVLVLDIWMPKKGGLDVMKAVTENWPEMPVIVISGGGPDATLENVTAVADLYGAIRVLYKPFDDEELVEAVAEALGA
jgi:DNA-binding NtrC family response regulator